MIRSGYTTEWKQSPNMVEWRKIGRGVYETIDGLYKCTKKGYQWIPSYRSSIDNVYVESKWASGSLSACQDECDRHQRLGKEWE